MTALMMRRRAMGKAAGVTDAFNRADSTTTMGNTDTGQAWSVLLGVWGISTNKAYRPQTGGTGDDLTVAEGSQADGTVSITTAGVPGGLAAAAGVSFRASDANNYWRLVADSGNVYLQKVAGGAKTTPASWPGAPADGDILSIVMSGNTLTAKRNGSTLGSLTDAHNATATKHGLALGGTSGDGSGVRLDDFSFSA